MSDHTFTMSGAAIDELDRLRPELARKDVALTILADRKNWRWEVSSWIWVGCRNPLEIATEALNKE